MDTLGDGVAIQRVSWRRPRAIDFRSIQGAMSTDGLGNLLSGLAGTVPNTTYATGISIVELTGVAARSVGASIGLVFVAIAFLPKLVAAIIAIPGPVVAGYFVLLVAKLFTFGIEILQHDGLDYRKGLVVGLGFWDRPRVPARLDLPGILPGALERDARQRDDGRRPDRDRP